MYEDVYNLFGEAVTKEQHGFVKNRSVLTNILAYLREIRANVISFSNDFSKAFDTVPVELVNLESVDVFLTY